MRDPIGLFVTRTIVRIRENKHTFFPIALYNSSLNHKVDSFMLARWLYTVAFYLAIPFLLFRLFKRKKSNPGYGARIGERFGFYSHPKLQGSIWFHTVSVGEFLAAKPLIDRVMAAHPQRRFVITNMTPTGAEQVRGAYSDQIANGEVINVYLPYDLPDAVGRFLRRFDPCLSVIMETELWPNVIHGCHSRKIPVLVANARLSEKSARGYEKVAALFRPMVSQITCVAAQSLQDGERFLRLGLPKLSLKINGTVKFDVNVDEALHQRAGDLRVQWGEQRNVVIAASTHRGEDEQILEAFLYIRTQVPGSLLVLVPRHPERFDEVAALVRKRGLNLSHISQGVRIGEECEVVLGDTMGDLLRMLGAADVAFVGGSLLPVGGHNMLEALAMGTPAITGPHVFNFQMVADMLTEKQVLITVNSPLALAETVLDLFQHIERRNELARLGAQVVNENRGATQRLFDLIQSYIG